MAVWWITLYGTGCLSSIPTWLACFTLYWCLQTRVLGQTSRQHALHTAATWHATPTATVCRVSASVCHLSGLSKHTKKLDSIHAMFCLFYSKAFGNKEKRRERGGEEGCLKRTPPIPLRTWVGGGTDGLCMGYLQLGGEWGNLALVAASTKNTARPQELEHRDILSKILQANEI